MSYVQPPEASAAEAGVEIVWPEPNELFIDIDEAEDLDVLNAHFGILLELYPGATKSVKPSRNRFEGAHVVVTLPRPVRDAEERLMLQAMLGSDRKRELLGLLQLRSGLERSTCFFKTRDP